jgi:hypothetical protein
MSAMLGRGRSGGASEYWFAGGFFVAVRPPLELPELPELLEPPELLSDPELDEPLPLDDLGEACRPDVELVVAPPVLPSDL